MTGLLWRSFLAAAVVAVVIIVRALLLYKLPKITFWAMWLVVVLRLLVPFSVPVFDAPDEGSVFVGAGRPGTGDMSGGNGGINAGNLSGGNDSKLAGDISSGNDEKNTGSISGGNDGKNTGNISGWNDRKMSDNLSAETKTDAERNTANLLAGTDSSIEEKPDRAWTKTLGNGQNRIPYIAIFFWVWLLGMTSVFLSFTISHLRARKLYSTALPVTCTLPEIDLSHGKNYSRRKNFFHKKRVRREVSKNPQVQWIKGIRRNVAVKTSDRIFAPVTYGICSPVILLPKNTDWENTGQLRMVLLHEAVHIRRFDILYKWLLAAAVSLHWFNPFVWVMYFLANRDIELSCDEAVIGHLSGCGKKDYALALLSYEEKRMFSPTVTGFGGNAVRERMEAIMKTKKKSVAGMAMAVLLVAGTTTVFAGAKDGKRALTDGQQVLSGTQEDGKNPGNQNPASLNVDGEGHNQDQPGQSENGGKNPLSEVKQYLCEPAYYTPEEFKEAMEQERESLKKEVAEGFLTQEGADQILAGLAKEYEEVKNGRQVEKPSQVYNADGTPLIGSDGNPLYAKASDIERMNKDLWEAAQWLGNATSIEEYDTQVELKFTEGALLPGGDFGWPDTDISWYTLEEYSGYVNAQKEEYRSMKGQWGFNLTDGWFEWDDEKIEIACQLLDQNLEFIKNGGRISRPDADGGVLMSGSFKDVEGTSEGEKWAIDEGDQWAMSLDEAKEKGYDVRMAEKMAVQEGNWKFDSAFVEAYGAFGITVDQKTGSYLYQGKKVAGFWDDGRVMADGLAQQDGGVYLKGVREDGKLVRLEEITKEEYCGLSGLAM